MATSVKIAHLECPKTSGFRNGVTASDLIGRKLGSIYAAPSDLTAAMDTLLHDLARKIGR